MTTKQKFNSIDQSKLSKEAKSTLAKMKKASDDFKNEAVTKKVDAALDQLISRLKKEKPEAIKKSKASAPKKEGESKKGGVMKLAKEIRKDGESWKDAVKRAGEQIKKGEKKAESEVKTELDKLKDLIENDEILRGFKKSDLSRDAKLKAKPRGKRKSTAGWKNQYGASKGGRTYYENRENRSDRYSPKYPKNKPFLASGGHLAQGDLQQLDIANADLFEKGGVTRSKRSINTDRARLSKEPWEQAYLPKRKGSYYAKGGALENSTYIPKEDVISVRLKNGKQYENDYSALEFLNGIYISDSVITKESDDENQMSLFKKGGKLPKDSIYIKRRDIDFVEYGDEDEPERVDGKHLVGGIWIDPKKQKTLIEEARKSGRLEAGGDLQQLDIANANLFAKGGYLSDHGLMEGDTIIKTIDDFQKIKDKDGNILFVDLENGYRDSEPPLPFKEGGVIDSSVESQKKWSNKQISVYDAYVGHKNLMEDLKEDLVRAKRRKDTDEIKRIERKIRSAIRYYRV